MTGCFIKRSFQGARSINIRHSPYFLEYTLTRVIVITTSSTFRIPQNYKPHTISLQTPKRRTYITKRDITKMQSRIKVNYTTECYCNYASGRMTENCDQNFDTLQLKT